MEHLHHPSYAVANWEHVSASPLTCADGLCAHTDFLFLSRDAPLSSLAAVVVKNVMNFSLSLVAGYPTGYPTAAPAYNPNMYPTSSPGYAPGKTTLCMETLYRARRRIWCTNPNTFCVLLSRGGDWVKLFLCYLCP